MKSRKLDKKEVRELREIIKNNERTGAEMKRAQTIILLDQEKEVEEIEGITGYGRSQIFELRKRYLQSGVVSIEDKRKGKTKELLTKKQRHRSTSFSGNQSSPTINRAVSMINMTRRKWRSGENQQDQSLKSFLEKKTRSYWPQTK